MHFFTRCVVAYGFLELAESECPNEYIGMRNIKNLLDSMEPALCKDANQNKSRFMFFKWDFLCVLCRWD